MAKIGLVCDDKGMRTYRQFGSRLEGHPTPRIPPTDVATGSLGQGLPIGVGLAVTARELDRQGLPYLYLDGQIRNRRDLVERFQSDSGCPFFLISLKAGGTGLNLTAADYVYLLDPWWNPAVEAQAIDRAHRIGQTRPVLACRIVARDTVEEKILELQKSKRDLADAILQADGSPLAGLHREDLELLLS